MPLLRPRRLAIAALALAGLALTGAAGLAALRHSPERRAPDPRPAVGQPGPHTDVVVVIGCTVRADQLTPWGAPTNITPWLEGMAAAGARFDATIAAAPWTKPAVTALITSQHGLVAGVTEPNPRANHRVLQDHWVTLAERMRASGRTTVGLSANPNADAPFAFHQGFEHYASAADMGAMGGAKIPGHTVVDRALRLVADVEGPLYLQLVLVDTHQPDTSTWLERLRVWQPGMSPRVVGYRAMARQLDDDLARLERGLSELGRAPPEAVWVFAGDHGEGLFHPWHHGRAHGEQLLPSSARVPWLVRGPGVARGHVVHGLSSQLDLAPTLGGLVGLAPVPEDQGHDWSDQLRGARDRTTRTTAVVDTWFRTTSRTALYTDERLCQVDHFPASTASIARRAELAGHRRPTFTDGCCRWREDPTCAHLEPLDQREALLEWRHRAGRSAVEPVNASLAPETEALLEELGYLD